MRYFALFLLAFTLLNSAILDKYCVDNGIVNAKLFKKNLKNNFEILKLPEHTATYSVPSIRIKKAFKEHNITIKDRSSGVVKFIKNCPKETSYQKEKSLLKKIFKKRYPDMEIKSLKLSPTSPFDKEGYTLKKIELNSAALRNYKGTLKAIYKSKDKKKIHYFRYELDAYIYLLKSTQDLKNADTLKENDYKMEKVKFRRLPLHVITKDLDCSYKVKGYIKKDTILTYNHLKAKKDLEKNSHIKAILQDGALILEMDAKLLKDANIGEIVKIRTTSGKVFKAKILPNGVAKILD